MGPHDPKNSFNRLPGYENPRLEKNLELSPIGKKLVLPYQALRGQKFKMAPTPWVGAMVDFWGIFLFGLRIDLEVEGN